MNKWSLDKRRGDWGSIDLISEGAKCRVDSDNSVSDVFNGISYRDVSEEIPLRERGAV